MMADARHAPAYEHNGRPVSAEDFYAIACDPQRSVAVEACAGAGKTWMLVSRIVRALLDGMDPVPGQPAIAPHDILAITFTKRAATEMRERLYLWLREFSVASEETLARELRSRGVAGDNLQVLGQRLASLYGRVLASGRLVQVRTFHSWFGALLKAAPLAVLQRLELPLNYELLEDDAQAVALVWPRFFQTLVDEPERRQDYQALVLLHGRSQTEKALSAALDKRIEFTLADAEGLVDTSVQPFGVLFPTLAVHASPVDALRDPAVRAQWLAWSQALGQETNKTPRSAANAVVDVFAAADHPDADLRACLVQLRGAFFVKTEDRLTAHLHKYPAAREAASALALLCAADHQHQAWLYQQRMARLARVLLRCYATVKRERGWVDMTDVERAALTLLSDPVLSGWVQERLDVRVRHLLIDEFQDTNPLQWQALSSWLGSYAGARGSAPSVFIVGDPKQSIYRFRRAEPQVFKAAQAFVATVLGGDRLSCDHTRRNAQGVIATVNATMFAASAAGAFEGFRTHTTDSDAAGLVATLPPIARPEPDRTAGDPQEPTWRDSLTTPRELAEETLRTLEARQVAHWIAHRVQAGWLPGDVMVLSRRRAGLQPMQTELRALGIAAQIGEKTALGDCCEVQDVVALLDVLVSSQHDLSLARALKSPLFGLPDAALLELALRTPEQRRPWFERLQQPWPQGSPLAGVGAQLQRWQEWVRTLPPHDALQCIYTSGDVLARFAAAAPATQRPAVLANLRALLEATLQVAGGRYATPYAFVRALKAGGVQAPAAVVHNAVRLLTIHGAKGLEARGVVLLDTDTPDRAADTMGVLVDWPGHVPRPERLVFLTSERTPPACAATLLAQEQAQRRREELNALYVAMTRARDTLLVSSIVPYRDAPDSWWRRLALQGLPALATPVPVSGRPMVRHSRARPAP
jgi:ATP-dependent helicase/nuclease subunit A